MKDVLFSVFFSVNSEKHLHWLVGVLWFTFIRLPQVPKVRCTDCTWGSSWLIKTNAKSRFASESSFHSSLAIWPQVADNTDIDGLIPWSAFEAKSVSKQPADTPFWIRSWADLRIPIRESAMGAKTTARGRQTDRQAGGQTIREERDGTLLAYMQKWKIKSRGKRREGVKVLLKEKTNKQPGYRSENETGHHSPDSITWPPWRLNSSGRPPSCHVIKLIPICWYRIKRTIKYMQISTCTVNEGRTENLYLLHRSGAVEIN